MALFCFFNLNPYLTRLVSLRSIFQERPGEEGSNVTGSQTIELITSNCIDPASESSLVTAPQESEGKEVTNKKRQDKDTKIENKRLYTLYKVYKYNCT